MAVTISLSIAQNSQSIANNTSNVTVKVTAKWTGGSNNRIVNASGTPQANGWVKIDGTSYTFASTFNDGQTTSGSKVICTKTVNVSHNTDGTKTLSCSASYTTGVSSGTVTASASKTLTTIPRKSTLTVGNGTLGTKQTLTVTEQASSFTHTITAKCGTASTTICTKSTSNSISFTPPLSWASQNTTGTSVSVTYTITTYNGNTSVGSNTYTKSCSIPSSVKPSCTVSVSDPTGYLDKYGGYVEGQSKVKVTVTPELAYGSAITSYKSTADGSTYTSASFTTSVLKSSGVLKVSSTVTDKRGRTSNAATASITVLAYSAPVISKLSVGRCNEDWTDNDQGENVSIKFNYSITSLSGKNIPRCTLQYKKSADDKYITPDDFDASAGKYMIKDADTASSYDILLTVSDDFTTSTKTTSASTAYSIMHWSADGRRMGIGKIAEQVDDHPDLLDIGFETRFAGGLLHPYLEPETDLNDVRTPNTYVGANVSASAYLNLPLGLTTGTFSLEVVGMGTAGQVKQRVTYCEKTKSRVWERIYYYRVAYEETDEILPYYQDYGEEEQLDVTTTNGNTVYKGVDAYGVVAYYYYPSESDGQNDRVPYLVNVIDTSWGDWVCVSDFDGQLLWEGGYYMTENHTATLAENVSKQRSGIVLVFSRYEGATKDEGFNEFFVPKMVVSKHGGKGHSFFLTDTLEFIGTKYLYIYDDKVAGYAGNNKTGTQNGITYANNSFVLRYIIGV